MVKEILDTIGSAEFAILVGIMLYWAFKRLLHDHHVHVPDWSHENGEDFIPGKLMDVSHPAWPGGNRAKTMPPPIFLPDNIIEYCDEESEDWARDDCRQRAREKHLNDNPNWDVVLTSLQREDGIIK